MRRAYYIFSVFILLGFLFPLASSAAETKGVVKSPENKLVVVGTGSIGGIYYPSGGAICRLLNRERRKLGIKCVVEATQGSVYNLNALRSAQMDFAIAQSDWQEHAYNGTSSFTKQGEFEKLRFLFSLHSEIFTVLVRKDSNIKKFDDIVDKTVNIGKKGSGLRATMEEIMTVKNWRKEDFNSTTEFGPAEQAKALCDNKIDVMILATGHPNGMIQKVSNMCNVRAIEVDDEAIHKFIANNPEYSLATIPGGLYPGLPNDTASFGVKATFVASSETSSEVAYHITRVVFENLEKFKKLHPVFFQLTKEDMISHGKTAPYHKGAEQYYREKGLL